jgi:hypothetical protein
MTQTIPAGTGKKARHPLTTGEAAVACRLEDFPVMPCEDVGFTRKPVGFFDRNLAIDLAPSLPGACGASGATGVHDSSATRGDDA